MKMNLNYIVLLLCICLSLLSFDVSKDGATARYKAYLGCTYTDNILLDVNTFKKMMSQPLCAKDSASNVFKVKSFEITYAERGLYQDDEGLPIIFTDYSADSFTGDTLNSVWKKRFDESLYKGDTVYFEQIICTVAEKKNVLCKPLKVIIK